MILSILGKSIKENDIHLRINSPQIKQYNLA